PALQPAHPGFMLGPMSPAERQRALRDALLSPETSGSIPPAEVARPAPLSPVDTAPGPLSSRHTRRGPGHLPVGLLGQRVCRGWRYPRWVETHWYHCLRLPRRAWPLVLGLAFVMTVLSGGLALALPGWLGDFRNENPRLFWLCLPCLSLPLLVFGYG